jgi:hypothetical protein
MDDPLDDDARDVLMRLGWDDRVAARLSELRPEGCVPGP